jgi:hypothetical protein
MIKLCISLNYLYSLSSMTVELRQYLQQTAFSSNVKKFKTSQLVSFGVKIDYFLRNKWNTGMSRMLA